VRAGIVSRGGECSKAQREPGWLVSTAAIATARAASTQCRPRLERRSRWRPRDDFDFRLCRYGDNWGSEKKPLPQEIASYENMEGGEFHCLRHCNGT
jgi:hypothetical protein